MHSNNQHLSLTSFDKIVQSEKYTIFVLGTNKKHFAIYAEPRIGEELQTILSSEKTLRPQSHEFFFSLYKSFGISVEQVILEDVQNNVYFAKIYCKQSHGDEKLIISLDARPSDALTLALMENAPIYCNKKILEKIEYLEE